MHIYKLTYSDFHQFSSDLHKSRWQRKGMENNLLNLGKQNVLQYYFQFTSAE